MWKVNRFLEISYLGKKERWEKQCLLVKRRLGLVQRSCISFGAAASQEDKPFLESTDEVLAVVATFFLCHSPWDCSSKEFLPITTSLVTETFLCSLSLTGSLGNNEPIPF